MDMGNGRRTFMLAAVYSLWGLLAAALAVPAGLYLLLPPRARKDDLWVDAGDAAGLQAGVPVEVVFRRNRTDGWRVISEKNTAWVVRKGEGEFAAFTPQCTHLGCAYSWSDQKKEFVCPCHASGFGLDGRVLFGPAPRGLDRFQAKVEKGRLMLGEVMPGPPAGAGA